MQLSDSLYGGSIGVNNKMTKIHNQQYRLKSLQAGLSLLEILVASSLSLFIIIGVASLYAANKNSSQLQNILSHLQRNSHFAEMRLGNTIRSVAYSGFYSSFSVGVETKLNTPNTAQWNIAKALQGFDNTSNDNSYAGISNIITSTDAILLKRMIQTHHLKTTSTTTTMTVDAANGYTAGDVLIATDQQQASIFQISAADNTSISGQTTVTIFNGSSPQPGNNALLNNIYGVDAEVGKLESVMYYLKIGSNGRAALFEARLKTSANTAPSMVEKEMIANVEDMQIIYGIDTDNNGSVDGFNNATTIEANNQWALVRTVGISLLMSSEDNNRSVEKNSYTFNGTRFTFVKDATASDQADKRLRRSFTTYISIRNS